MSENSSISDVTKTKGTIYKKHIYFFLSFFLVISTGAIAAPTFDECKAAFPNNVVGTSPFDPARATWRDSGIIFPPGATWQRTTTTKRYHVYQRKLPFTQTINGYTFQLETGRWQQNAAWIVRLSYEDTGLRPIFSFTIPESMRCSKGYRFDWTEAYWYQPDRISLLRKNAVTGDANLVITKRSEDRFTAIYRYKHRKFAGWGDSNRMWRWYNSYFDPSEHEFTVWAFVSQEPKRSWSHIARDYPIFATMGPVWVYCAQ